MVYKNNSDRKGNSYGTHENYLMDRQVPFSRIVTHVMPHFVTRQVYTGAGGSAPRPPASPTTCPSSSASAPILRGGGRARDHAQAAHRQHPRRAPADAQRYRRLHVIVGDANLAEVATFLKVGTTALVLSMIEDDFLPRDLSLATPVAALRKVSYDLSLRLPLELADGSTMTALEIQWEYLDRAKKYAEEFGLDQIGAAEIGADLLRRWEDVLTALETDPMSLAAQVDWVAKKRLIDGHVLGATCRWDDARLAAMDLQYHDLRPGKSLASRVGLERLTNDAEVARAVYEPPVDTRAYFRGKCLQRWVPPDRGGQLGFHGLRHRRDPPRRVPMMDPTRGTEAHVGG